MAAAAPAAALDDDEMVHMSLRANGGEHKGEVSDGWTYVTPTPARAGADSEPVVVSSGSEAEAKSAAKLKPHKTNAHAASDKGYKNTWFKRFKPENIFIKVGDMKSRPPCPMAPSQADITKREKELQSNAEKKKRHMDKLAIAKAKRAADAKEETDDEFSEEEVDEIDDSDLVYVKPTTNSKGEEEPDVIKDGDNFAKTGFRVNGKFKENTYFVGPFMTARRFVSGLGEWDSIKKNRNSTYAPKGFDDGHHQAMFNVTSIDDGHQTDNGWDPTIVEFDQWTEECHFYGARQIRKTGMRPKLFNKIAEEIRAKELAERHKAIKEIRLKTIADYEKKIGGISKNKHDKIMRKLDRKDKWVKRVDPDEVCRLFAKRYLGSAVVTSKEGQISGDPIDKSIIFECSNCVQYSKEEFLALTPETTPIPPDVRNQTPLDYLNSILFHRRVIGQLPYRLFQPGIILAKTGRKLTSADPVNWFNIVVGQNDLVAPAGFFDYNFNSPTCRVRYTFLDIIWHSKGVSTFGQRRIRDRSSELDHVAFEDADTVPRALTKLPFDMNTVKLIEVEINNSDTKKNELATQRKQTDDKVAELREALKQKWKQDAETKRLEAPKQLTDEEKAAEATKAAAAAAKAAEEKAARLKLSAEKSAAAKAKAALAKAAAAEMTPPSPSPPPQEIPKAAAPKRKATDDVESDAKRKKAKSDDDDDDGLGVVVNTPPSKETKEAPPPPSPPRRRSRSRSASGEPRRRERSPLPKSPSPPPRSEHLADEGEIDDSPPPPPPPKKKAAPATVAPKAKPKAKKKKAVISDDDNDGDA
jgi:hypothetical protein